MNELQSLRWAFLSHLDFSGPNGTTIGLRPVALVLVYMDDITIYNISSTWMKC